MVCSAVKISEFNDVKRALSLDFETGNRTKSKIKRLKCSKSAYLGHITKTISRINTLMSEPDNVETVICLQDQLDNLVAKLKTVLDTLVELSDSSEEVFVYDELHFEQKERIVNFKRQISTYSSENSLEFPSETQFPLTKPVNYHDELKTFSNQENVINTEFNGNFQNRSPKVRSQSIVSKSSHSSNSSNSRSSRTSLAELEIKKQQAEILACQKKESYERKIKLLERQKELELEMEKKKHT